LVPSTNIAAGQGKAEESAQVVSRGFQVPRRRREPPALALLAGALAAALVVPAGDANAQASGNAATGTTNSTDSLLMRPVLDGDPRNPPRFRSARKSLDNTPARFGQLPNFDYQPAFGAGTTGFDSTNAIRRKAKSGQAKSAQAQPGQQANPGNATDPGAPSAATSTAGAAPVPGAPSTPDSYTPNSFTPKQLQPAGAVLPGRIFNQNRPGAPPVSPDAVTATIATTPPSRRQPPEERPFDPIGIQAGAFSFRPAMEYIRGFDTNPARNATGPNQSSWFNIYAPELLVNSNWARHELTASLRGTYATFDTMHQLDRPTVDARVNGRIDVTSQTRIDLEGRYLLFTDYPGSPNIQAGVSHLPIAMTWGGSAGIGQRFNRFEVALKGSVDRTVYNDSEFVDGETASNAGRNYNRYGALLRTGYEVTPGVKPFVELGGDTRQYDLAIDAAGVNRTSQGRYAKVGTTFELRPKLTGEASFGYLSRSYRDPTLEDVHGWTADAAIVWLASALTTVKLTSTTSTAESTLPGVSGAFTRETTLQVDHAFRRWLVASLRFTRGFDDYVGSTREDLRYVASSALTYSLSREIVLRGEFRQEWRHSNTPGNDYFANVWLLGVRLQR
jgi:hypothetical protein